MIPKTLRCAALGLLLPLHCLAAGVTLHVTPVSQVLAPGDSTFVELAATYDGSDLLLGGSVGLSFRADLLEVLGVTLRAPSDVAGTTGAVSISGSDGIVGAIGFATFAGTGGTFDLATVEFRARGGVGTSPLLVFDAADPVYAWVNEAFEAVSVTSGQGVIAVSAVPEPNSAAMLLTGFLLLAATAGRRRTPAGRVASRLTRSRERPESM